MRIERVLLRHVQVPASEWDSKGGDPIPFEVALEEGEEIVWIDRRNEGRGHFDARTLAIVWIKKTLP